MVSAFSYLKEIVFVSVFVDFFCHSHVEQRQVHYIPLMFFCLNQNTGSERYHRQKPIPPNDSLWLGEFNMLDIPPR